MEKEIQEFFKGDIQSDIKTIEKYSHDASLFEVKPQIVLFPMDAEDIKNVIRFVNLNKKKHPKLSVTARSAGSCMSGGSLNDSIILDVTRYMNGTLSVDEKKREAVVLPGTYYRD